MFPVLLIGAGHMGGALSAGWRLSKTAPATDIWILDPNPGPSAQAAIEAGAKHNPPHEALMGAKSVILAVKPQVWRPIISEIAPRLAPGAVIISIMAGVAAQDIATVLPDRPVARAMPNTACAICRGATGVWAKDMATRHRVSALFAPLGAVVDLGEEAEIHAVTAASGSSPAYIYALVEALEAAGQAAGLTGEAARVLSRSALTGAAALLEASGESAGALRRQVTSPNGTTEAALKVLTGDGALGHLVERAVLAAKRRSQELGDGS